MKHARERWDGEIQGSGTSWDEVDGAWLAVRGSSWRGS